MKGRKSLRLYSVQVRGIPPTARKMAAGTEISSRISLIPRISPPAQKSGGNETFSERTSDEEGSDNPSLRIRGFTEEWRRLAFLFNFAGMVAWRIECGIVPLFSSPKWLTIQKNAKVFSQEAEMGTNFEDGRGKGKTEKTPKNYFRTSFPRKIMRRMFLWTTYFCAEITLPIQNSALLYFRF